MAPQLRGQKASENFSWHASEFTHQGNPEIRETGRYILLCPFGYLAAVGGDRKIMMGVAEHLASFLKLASKNRHFYQSHLSLYSAILMHYDKGSSQNPFRVSRKELMRHSAIRSSATYHKCMADLMENGLIEYEPSYHPTLASRLTLLDNNGEP